MCPDLRGEQLTTSVNSVWLWSSEWECEHAGQGRVRHAVSAHLCADPQMKATAPFVLSALDLQV